MLTDTYGRVATDLRVSLTDRCNLRCTYCMPEEGLQWLGKTELLDDDEIVRLVRIAVTDLGITEVRFTGGEPCCAPVSSASSSAAPPSAPPAAVADDERHRPGAHRPALRDAGLDRVNVSLDTLRPEVFRTMTRRKRHDDVLRGLRAARAAGLTPVKVNAVLMPGLNDDEAPTCSPGPSTRATSCASSSRCRSTPSTAGSARAWSPRATSSPACAPASTSRPRTTRPVARPRRALAGRRRPGPRRRHRLGDPPFCRACDRTRLTADGQVRTCLFAREESDLRGALRSGAADEEIARLWRLAMWGKKAGSGLDDPSFLQPDRPMSAIGG
ncbi:radical SAM protein [Streptomyces sp. M19]